MVLWVLHSKSINLMYSICGTNFQGVSSNSQRHKNENVSLWKITIFVKPLFWLTRKLLEFQPYRILLHSKLMGIISGSCRNLWMGAIMSGSGDIQANMRDIFCIRPNTSYLNQVFLLPCLTMRRLENRIPTADMRSENVWLAKTFPPRSFTLRAMV